MQCCFNLGSNWKSPPIRVQSRSYWRLCGLSIQRLADRQEKSRIGAAVVQFLHCKSIHRSVWWEELISVKFTPPTHSSHYQLALPPSCVGHRVACSLVLCPGGQLFCLKLTQRHTQRYKRRNGGYEEPIREPWNRPGLTGVKATCPACQISKEVMSRYPKCYQRAQWHPRWTVCNT